MDIPIQLEARIGIILVMKRRLLPDRKLFKLTDEKQAFLGPSWSVRIFGGVKLGKVPGLLHTVE